MMRMAHNTTDRGRIYGLSIIFSLVFLTVTLGQSDNSLLLDPERLHDSDVLVFDIQQFRGKVASATLVEEDPVDLPFTTWVITAEEISLYGFTTLGDVLRAAPGIRVSQPGNAREGETFMVMGLVGNQYMKVLLNGVPIKPGMSLGMPIAAQLPIRQAERIELVYGGAGGFLFGNEACAGVVNIIIKESERPVYTQADLVFGSLGHNSLDVTLGGKLFKGKNIGKFSLYGSSTVRANSDVFWNTSVLRPNDYVPLGFQVADLAAFSNIQLDAGGALPRFAPAQQESRIFGAQVEWRGFRFQFHRMNRSEAAFLGYSPLAVSHTALGNSYRDLIEAYSLEYSRRAERSQFLARINASTYEVENTSSVRYGFDRWRQFRYWASRADTLTGAASRLFHQKEDSLYASGQRFMVARGVDVRLDVRFRQKIGARLYWDGGALVGVSAGNPLSSYYSAPPDVGNNPGPTPFPTDLRVNVSTQLYSGLDWQGKRFRWNVGIAASPLVMSGLSFAEERFLVGYAPRVAIGYRIDSVQHVYVNYARSFKAFHVAQAALSYTYDVTQQVFFSGAAFDQQLEQFESVFVGYRFGRSELVGFGQRSVNLIRDGYLLNGENNFYKGGYQYANGTSQLLWGAQLRLVFEKNLKIELGKDKKEQQVLWRAAYFLQWTKGREYFGYGLLSTEEIRNFPTWMSQGVFSGKAGRIQLALMMNHQGSTMSQGVPFAASWKREGLIRRIPKYSTWDIQARFFVNKHFLLYASVHNLFNQAAYGLDLSGGPEDQVLPLLQGRLWRFGVNYNMN
jgi:hypothetical protein